VARAGEPAQELVLERGATVVRRQRDPHPYRWDLLLPERGGGCL
jgi:hypothetical protein